MTTPRRIIITGGSSGLGLALARHYAAEGHRLGLVARNREKLEATVAELNTLSPGGTAEYRSADVSDESAAAAAIEQLADSLGGIDLLINSAGILREGRFEELPPETFHQLMDANLFGTINTTRAALPYLQSSRGQLVNIASMAAFSGVFGYSAYTASKHALAGFTESLRYELKPRGITVQLVCPPEFDSPMVDELDRYRSAENRAHTQMIPKEPVEAIARDTVKAIASRRYLTVTGFRARCAALGIRHFPGITRFIADRVISKASAGAP